MASRSADRLEGELHRTSPGTPAAADPGTPAPADPGTPAPADSGTPAPADSGRPAAADPRSSSAADCKIVERELSQARELAARPGLIVDAGQLRWVRRKWRRFAAWWTGYDVDQAWAALHTVGQALLGIENEEVVKSQLGDMAAQVVTAFAPGDLRVKDYLKTLELLAPADVHITVADRA